MKTNKEKKSSAKKVINQTDKKSIGSDSKDVSIFNTGGKPIMNNFIIFSNNAKKNPNGTPSAASTNLSMAFKKDLSNDNKPKRNSSAKKFESPSSSLFSKTLKHPEKRINDKPNKLFYMNGTSSVASLKLEDDVNKNSNYLRSSKLLNLLYKNDSGINDTDRMNSMSSNRFGGTGKTNLTFRVEDFMKQIPLPEQQQISNRNQYVQPQEEQHEFIDSIENSHDSEFIYKMRNKNKEVLGHINNLDSEILRY